MALADPPTAFFCASNSMAIGCYEALRVLKALGKTVPQDVSVVGYDDDWMASNLSPTLTTIPLPHEAKGRWAAEHLVAPPGCAGAGRCRPVELECPLIERSSIASRGSPPIRPSRSPHKVPRRRERRRSKVGTAPA